MTNAQRLLPGAAVASTGGEPPFDELAAFVISYLRFEDVPGTTIPHDQVAGVTWATGQPLRAVVSSAFAAGGRGSLARPYSGTISNGIYTTLAALVGNQWTWEFYHRITSRWNYSDCRMGMLVSVAPLVERAFMPNTTYSDIFLPEYGGGTSDWTVPFSYRGGEGSLGSGRTFNYNNPSGGFYACAWLRRIGARTGKKYWEFHVDNVGTPTQRDIIIGLIPQSKWEAAPLPAGYARNPFGTTQSYCIVGGNGAISPGFIVDGVLTANGACNFTTGDTIGVAVDFDTGNVWFLKNNVSLSGDPASGTVPACVLPSAEFDPWVSLYGNVSTQQVTFNETTPHLTYAAPFGFEAVCDEIAVFEDKTYHVALISDGTKVKTYLNHRHIHSYTINADFLGDITPVEYAVGCAHGYNGDYWSGFTDEAKMTLAVRTVEQLLPVDGFQAPGDNAAGSLTGLRTTVARGLLGGGVGSSTPGLLGKRSSARAGLLAIAGTPDQVASLRGMRAFALRGNLAGAASAEFYRYTHDDAARPAEGQIEVAAISSSPGITRDYFLRVRVFPTGEMEAHYYTLLGGEFWYAFLDPAWIAPLPAAAFADGLFQITGSIAVLNSSPGGPGLPIFPQGVTANLAAPYWEALVYFVDVTTPAFGRQLLRARFELGISYLPATADSPEFSNILTPVRGTYSITLSLSIG